MITKEQARGDSPEVSVAEYENHVRMGKVIMRRLMEFDESNRGRRAAWHRTRESWGGVTLRMPGQSVAEFIAGYAVAVSRGDTVSIPADADASKFADAYDLAARRFAYAPFMGVFRDDDLGVIEFDAVVVTPDETEAREIATACGSLGGAYDFATGNGVFPYHVADDSPVTVN